MYIAFLGWLLVYSGHDESTDHMVTLRTDSFTSAFAWFSSGNENPRRENNVLTDIYNYPGSMLGALDA